MNLREKEVDGICRIVVKLGTGLLTDSANRLDRQCIGRLVKQLALLATEGRQLLLVSSGAIAAGMAQLGLVKRPRQLAQLQAAASIGQSKLMALYDEIFGKFKIHVAQILLTHQDLGIRERHLNARQTLNSLLARDIVPVINENDTVAVDEIRFGDNDYLAALTALLIDADLLIILSHVEGLCRREPVDGVSGQVISKVDEITPEIENLAGGTRRATSVGGMISKIQAGKMVTRAGIPMMVASGLVENVLPELLAGKEKGTLFLPRKPRLASRKRWIAFFQRPEGVFLVDRGARKALCKNDKSLLAKGVVSTQGRFCCGDAVSIRDENDVEFARGLTKVSCSEVRSEMGVVIHRDDLVIL